MKRYLTLKNLARLLFFLFMWALFLAMEFAFDGEITSKSLVVSALMAITTFVIPPLVMKRYQKKSASNN